jgi:signal transduction histidine kinase
MAIIIAISLAFSIVVYHFAIQELTSGLTTQTQRWYDEFPGLDAQDRYLNATAALTTGRHHILINLFEFNILVLVGAGFASYLLARRTLEPIEAAHKQQKRFTADVSHELRTPLTALRMESEVALMNSHASREELRVALEGNLEEASKMDSLINNLLRLTRLEAGPVQNNFTTLSAKALVETALGYVAKQARVKHITLENNAKALRIVGDEDSLVQLLVILLDNAIKYSPQSSTIHLDTKKAKEMIHIIVRDEGQGIAPAALPHVFDRFYREDAVRTNSAEQGYGLGLSIAKLISDVHSGNITLTSKLGKGTTATIALPLERKMNS